MDVNQSPRASSSMRLTAVVAVVLAAISSALAQNGPARGAKARPPAREGNIFDHQDHQPTQAEVDSAEAAASARVPSESDTQVESEVNTLLRQTDKLDKQSDEDLKGDPNGGR
jgi:hypothetical protein